MAIVSGLDSMSAGARVSMAKSDQSRAGTVTSRTMAAHADTAQKQADKLADAPTRHARVARAGITKPSKTGGDTTQPPVSARGDVAKNTPAEMAAGIKAAIERDPVGALKTQTAGLSSQSSLARHAGPQGPQGASMAAMAGAGAVHNPTAL
jgi:hypothetical protein